MASCWSGKLPSLSNWLFVDRTHLEYAVVNSRLNDVSSRLRHRMRMKSEFDFYIVRDFGQYPLVAVHEV